MGQRSWSIRLRQAQLGAIRGTHRGETTGDDVVVNFLKRYLDMGSVEAIAEELAARETSTPGERLASVQTACAVLVTRDLEVTVRALTKTVKDLDQVAGDLQRAAIRISVISGILGVAVAVLALGIALGPVEPRLAASALTLGGLLILWGAVIAIPLLRRLIRLRQS